MIDIDKKILQDTINDLKNNPDACKIEGANKENGVITMGYSVVGEQLDKFINYFFEKELFDKNYFENTNNARNKEIATLNIDEVLTELTVIFRAEKFCDGALYEAFKSRKILLLLERLNFLLFS